MKSKYNPSMLQEVQGNPDRKPKPPRTFLGLPRSKVVGLTQSVPNRRWSYLVPSTKGSAAKHLIHGTLYQKHERGAYLCVFL